MKAAVWYGSRDIRIESVDDPIPGDDDIVIQVSRNGLCGSDLHTYEGAQTGGATMHVPGVVLGHEFAGTVVARGRNVSDLKEGDHVAIAPIEYCGTCEACSSGNPNMCRELAIYGGYRLPLHGGLAPYARVSRRSAYKIPDGLSVVDAALTEPMAVAVHAVRRAPKINGAHVLVLGGGPIGLGILQAAIALGAESVVVSEPASGRREAAVSMGALFAVNPMDDESFSQLRAHRPIGFDLVFDTTAVHVAFNQGIKVLKAHGVLVSVAGWQEFAKVDMGRAMTKEIEIRYAMTYQPELDFPATLNLLASGKIDAKSLTSDHIKLDDLVHLGIEELIQHPESHLKILVDPSR